MMKKPAGALREVYMDSFRWYCCHGKYARAFEVAEAALLKNAGSIGELCNPWINDRTAPQAFWKKQRALLAAAAVPRRHALWKAFYLAALTGMLQPGQAAPGLAKLRRAFTGRYAWMRFPAACAALEACNWRAAAADFKLIVRAMPYDWLARCKYGEALICAGETGGGLGEFDAALALKNTAQDSVAAWKGEMLLMLGEYAGAARCLEAAGPRAAFAGCWLGAAYFKTGRTAKALKCLDLCVKNDAADDEAKLWRAELYRAVGKPRKAVKELDALLARRPDYSFARFNRALARRALGDYEGLRGDFRLLDRKLTGLIAAKLGLKAAQVPAPQYMLAVLSKGLELAKGNRRWEKHFLNIQFRSR